MTRRTDRGAVLVVTALLITTLLVLVAIVIDLGATRSDRRGGQLAVDNATTAAGMALVEGSAQDACRAAINYLEATLGVTFSIPAGGCAALEPCNATNPPLPITAPGYRGLLHHPVPNSSPLLSRSSTISADSARFDGDRPGTGCERFAVQLETIGSAYFGGIVGQHERRSEVHAVALVGTPEDSDRLINLAVLNRHECGAIDLDGQGGVIAGPVVDGATVEPGTIAVDSDGTINCGTTVSLSSANNVLRADGPAGCAGQLPTGVGHGCGRIDLYASGAPGCTAPACSRHAGSTLGPTPQRATHRVTRQPIDHKYDCKASYESSFWWSAQPDIAPCPDSGVRPAYISALISAMPTTGAPAGWQTYPRPGTPTDTCSHNTGAPTSTITVPPGNWFVDCPTLNVGRPLIFQGGNILFRGNVTVGAQGKLFINTANPNTFTWTENAAFNAAHHSSQAAYVFFRDGTFSKGGQGEVTLNNVVAYISRTSTLTLGGGDGALNWTAPRTGPFQDLAMWADTSNTTSFGGQASLTMDGAFFMPMSTMNYSGQGDNDVTAQFIANKIAAGGQGAVNLTPTRGVGFPPTPTAVTLIR